MLQHWPTRFIMNSLLSNWMRCLLILWVCVSAQETRSEDQPRHVAAYKQSVDLLVADKPAQALEILTRLIDEHGEDAEIVLGPAFGNLLYHQGVAHQMLGNYSSAAKAFERCYVRFPNQESEPNNRNEFRNLALHSWASVEHIQTHYGNASKLYAKALNSLDPELNPNSLLLNLGICLRQDGRYEPALRHFETVLHGGVRKQATSSQRLRALLQLARHWIESGDANEANQLLDQHGELLATMDPIDPLLHPLLLYLGERTTYLSEHELALRWYNLVNDEAHPSLQLGKAHAFFELGRFSDALETYEQLALLEEHEKRDEILLAASLSATHLGDMERATAYAEHVRNEFPTWHRWPEAYVALCDRFLRDDRPIDTLNWAEKIRCLVPGETAARQQLDFVSALSNFRLGDAAFAAELFQLFVVEHMDSDLTGRATYQEALCRLQLGEHDSAAILFENVLALYDDTTWGPGVRYRCAQTYLHQARTNQAIALLEEVLYCFADSPQVPDTLLLLGNIYLEQDQPHDALLQFEQASVSANTLEDEEALAQSLSSRANVYLQLGKWTVGFTLASNMAEDFPCAVQTRTTLLRIAESADHQEDLVQSRTLLWNWLTEQAAHHFADELEAVVQMYSTLFKRSHTYEEHLDHLEQRAHEVPESPVLASLLLHEQINALAGAADRPSLIHVLHEQLLREFDLANLSTGTLLHLARWLGQKNRTQEALDIYEFASCYRDDSPQQFDVAIEYASLLAKTRKNGGFQRANQLLTEVVQYADQSHAQEAATAELARIQYQALQWKDSGETWRFYLTHQEWTDARAEATYRLGACLDRQGNTEEALSQYLKAYIQFEGQVRWSSPAFLRSALIAQEQGDQEKALSILDDMMSRMGHLTHPIVNKARTLHQRWGLAVDRRLNKLVHRCLAKTGSRTRTAGTQ